MYQYSKTTFATFLGATTPRTRRHRNIGQFSSALRLSDSSFSIWLTSFHQASWFLLSTVVFSASHACSAESGGAKTLRSAARSDMLSPACMTLECQSSVCLNLELGNHTILIQNRSSASRISMRDFLSSSSLISLTCASTALLTSVV